MWPRIRNSFLLRSIATLLAILVCGSALDWGHIGGDDRDCDIVIVNHHDHAAQFSAAPVNAPTSDHCYLCHSLRLLHQAVTTRHERVAVTRRTTHHLEGDILAVRDGVHVGVGSRGPPSISL